MGTERDADGLYRKALAAMKSDGTLDQLTKKWLKVYTSIPSLEP